MSMRNVKIYLFSVCRREFFKSSLHRIGESNAIKPVKIPVNYLTA